jgi:hypothetical protein
MYPVVSAYDSENVSYPRRINLSHFLKLSKSELWQIYTDLLNICDQRGLEIQKLLPENARYQARINELEDMIESLVQTGYQDRQRIKLLEAELERLFKKDV